MRKTSKEVVLKLSTLGQTLTDETFAKNGVVQHVENSEVAGSAQFPPPP
jgi:hypothetical protein